MDRVFLSLFVASVLMAGVAQTHAQTASAKLGSKPLVTVNLNTATATELEGLPGIGPSTAARIVEYRQKNGPFKKIEEILEIHRSVPDLLNISSYVAPAAVSRSR